MLGMLQCSRKLVGGSNVQEIVRGALHRDNACSCRIGERFGPCCNVGMIPFGIYIELLPKVRI
jgi:hypothetical protein